jgi:putative PIN family toxin of toxin-antitoxin system
MRFVLDPNVLISALLTRDGAPAELLTRWLAGEFEAVASEALLAELESVLMREKFRPYVEVHEARAFVALVRASAMMVPDAGASAGLSPDPGDDYLFALAAATRADALVTGDKALLGASAVLPVVSPAATLHMLDGRIPGAGA